MKFQTYHINKNCCKLYDGGTLIYNNIPHCRWCRTPFEQGGEIHYEEEHFKNNEIEENANILFSIKNRTYFEDYLVHKTLNKKLNKENNELITIIDEQQYKIRELLKKSKSESLDYIKIDLLPKLEIGKLTEDEKKELKKKAYVQDLLIIIKNLEKKIKNINNNCSV